LDYAIRFHKFPQSLADRLKEIFVITPTEKLQKYTWDDVRYFIHEGKLKERPPTAIPPESALVKLGTTTITIIRTSKRRYFYTN
jgi:hypothetical protein